MTLYKQLALLLSLFLLIILSTVMVLKFNETIKTTKEQLYNNAQNTAATLSLSLATARGDEAILSTMINANFDSGHYRSIVLTDMQDKVIFKRVETSCEIDVPEWFISFVDIDVPEASAPVSSGWMVIGKLTVESDATPSYMMLYDSFRDLLMTFTFFIIISLVVLYLLLYTILRPLRELQKQSEAISRNEFTYQELLPYTTEFKEIVSSMNAMVKKMESNFSANAQVVQQNRQLLYAEKLPKLYNEHYLMLKCNEECMQNSEYDGGVVIVMELQMHNGALSIEDSEAFFVSLASIMIEKSAMLTNTFVARLADNRLVLLMPGAGELQACNIKQTIHDIFAAYMEQKAGSQAYTLQSGMYLFTTNERCQDFLQKAVADLSETGNEICTNGQEALRYKEQLTQDDWSYLITTALRKELFTYEVRNVIDTTANAIYDRGITIVMRDSKGTVYPYGRFIAAAVKTHKVLDIYMQVIKVLVQNFSSHDKKGRYTFSFANALLQEERTFGILKQEFENFDNTHDLDFCIELPESFLVASPEAASKYVDLIKEHGYRFSIGEFSAEADDLEYLKRFKPEFIKMSKLFLLDMIEKSSPLLSSLQMAADALDIKIIATGVSSETELIAIRKAGITIVQGLITEVI